MGACSSRLTIDGKAAGAPHRGLRGPEWASSAHPPEVHAFPTLGMREHVGLGVPQTVGLGAGSDAE